MIYLVPGEFETIKVYDFQGTLKYTKINTETKKSTEWNWQKASYKLGSTQSQLRNNENISTLNIHFENRRYKPFVDLTLYTPIYVLMILLPLGVLIPGYFEY